MNIDWVPPEPRTGLRGRWDAFVGPGATASEESLQLVFGGVLSCICLGLFFQAFGTEASWLQIIAAAVLAFDISGGVVTNATSSAKRWFHRDGTSNAAHLRFIAAHVLHLAAVAWLFSETALLYFVSTSAFLLGGSCLVAQLPLYLQRPAAFGVTAIGIALSSLPPFAIFGLEWFLPLLLLKLILGHLLKEAPFRQDAS